MTNLQIIEGMKEITETTEEVDTYAGWKRRGYQVQKGERAVFTTKIWKPVKVKVDEDEEEKKLIMVKASFFGRSQVEGVQ